MANNSKYTKERPIATLQDLAPGVIYMGPSIDKQVEFKFIALGSIKKLLWKIWDAIQMPDTVITLVNALVQGQPNDLDFLDSKKRHIGELDITRVDDGETESPHIDMIEPETDIYYISADAEKLLELVERQDMPTVEVAQYMGIGK